LPFFCKKKSKNCFAHKSNTLKINLFLAKNNYFDMFQVSKLNVTDKRERRRETERESEIETERERGREM